MNPQYFIAASPLVKVFLPEWEDRLKENPELIYDYETPFSFSVSAGTEGLIVFFNTPMVLPESIRKTDQDRRALYSWLVGGEDGLKVQETNQFGIVAFDPGINLLSTTDQLATLDAFMSDDPEKALAAKKKQEALMKEASSKVKTARDRVRFESDRRVKMQMRLTHNNLIAQWRVNEEAKMGKYPASFTETMGAIAMDLDIKAAEAKNQKLRDRMNTVMTGQV